MNWKKWPYWARGGVLGFLVTIIFLPFGYSPVGVVTGFLLAPSVFLVKSFFMRSVVPSEEEIGNTISVSSGVAGVFQVAAILSPIFWFIIGAILGWIYGKIKSKESRRWNVESG